MIPYDPLKRTLLMSLHPENVAAIINQTKIIEYRRRFFKAAFQAFVCTTGPHGGIALFLDCDTPITADADHLARLGQRLQGDTYSEIFNYFQPRNTGVIIPIKAAISLQPLDRHWLQQTFPGFSVPQAYLFLDTPAKQPLLDCLLQTPTTQQWALDWTSRYDEIAQLLTH